MGNAEFGYVGRVRACGCVVMLTVDEECRSASLADNLADAIRDGLYVERLPIDVIKTLRLGACPHEGGDDRTSRSGTSVFRAEAVILCAARDEDEAERVAGDLFRFGTDVEVRVAQILGPSGGDSDAAVYRDGDDDDEPSFTFAEWLEQPLSETEMAARYRRQIEALGQQRLPIGGVA